MTRALQMKKNPAWWVFGLCVEQFAFFLFETIIFMVKH
jgi:hypothetical protein